MGVVVLTAQIIFDLTRTGLLMEAATVRESVTFSITYQRLQRSMSKSAACVVALPRGRGSVTGCVRAASVSGRVFPVLGETLDEMRATKVFRQKQQESNAVGTNGFRGFHIIEVLHYP
jgi:hypothetical protein